MLIFSFVVCALFCIVNPSSPGLPIRLVSDNGMRLRVVAHMSNSFVFPHFSSFMDTKVNRHRSQAEKYKAEPDLCTGKVGLIEFYCTRTSD